MLSAAVVGAVFASPPPSSILAAIRTVGKGNCGKNIINVITLNYDGAPVGDYVGPIS